MPRTYTVRAVWDDDAKVWVADSDIEGLHIEADSIDAFESTLHASPPSLLRPIT
ncbi:DUF1902 domain-containing protein [Oceaniradius stylonematis]|uniref:DUF1902 domain-containing protein n=1 Tax=Oceaniradius stylonematis TaxID=2184161 RepID=UPI0035D0B578